VNDDGFVLEAGSQVSKVTVASLPKHVRGQRDVVLDSDSARDVGEHYVLDKQVQMSSSSTAASFVSGSNRSGPASWKDPAGRSLGEIEAEAVALLPPEVAE
jgi:hypothetical protein